MFLLRGTWPLRRRLSGNLLEKISGDATGGSENSRPAGGTGATPLVASILRADRQERSSRPPQEEHPTPRPLETTTFTAPEGVRIF